MRIFLSTIFLSLVLFCTAQKDTAVENLQNKLATIVDVSKKLDIVLEIAGKYILKNPQACEDILNKGIFIAEESRDREMMIKAQRIAGSLYAQFSSLKQYSEKAINYTTQALELCKKANGIEAEKTNATTTK